MRGPVECRPTSAPAGLDAEDALARLRESERRRDEAEQRLAELTGSLSWRVTRPLRLFGRVTRRS
jgi:hypothetical protein